MKKISVLFISLMLLSFSVFAADVLVTGKLSTWAATVTNNTDKDSDASDSVGFIYAFGEINTKVKLAENVTVLLEVELNDKVSNGASMVRGKKFTGGNGGPNPATVEIDEAWVQIDEFFTETLSLKVGNQRLEWSLRNNKRSMVINGDFTAFKLDYKFEKGFLDAFYGKKFESLSSNIGSSDTDIFGLHFEMNITENGHVIAYVNDAIFDNAGAEPSNIATFGAGVQWFLLDKHLEVFAEVAGQVGQISKNVDQNGFGADLGARWVFDEIGSVSGVYVELNFGYRSGQDSSSDVTKFWNQWSASAGTLLAEGRYASESPLYQGYVPDSYMAIRLEAGANWTKAFTSNLAIAYYDNTNKGADPYGVEVDISTKYKYSDNLSFLLHLATFLPDDGLVLGASTENDPIFAIAFETTVLF